ncbi:MAG TPA: hypothetical protein VMT60_03805, partial [Candidatus Bathyarchaeia archaeon]|nr:hypothetical protein [Candidatus Bathyarchaeia archaeon]
TIAGGWHKSVWTQPLQAPFSYSDSNARVSSGRAVTSYASPAATVYPEESVASWESAWNSGSSLTLGFSLHYRDRFFIDVYTDTDIIPQYLADNLIDVRYVF